MSNHLPAFARFRPCHTAAATAALATLLLPLAAQAHLQPASPNRPAPQIAIEPDLDIRVEAEADPSSEVDPVAYLEQLAACSPGAQSPAMAFPFGDLLGIDGILLDASVEGWEGDRCRVISYAFLDSSPDNKVEMANCLHTADTLAIMTDEVAYEQAQSGEYSFDSASERDVALAAATDTECEANFTWLEELTGIPAL